MRASALGRVLRSAQEAWRFSDPGSLPGTVRMHFWTGANLGEFIAPVIVQHFTGLRPEWVPRAVRRKVLSIGSFLHDRAAPGDIVWGTGTDRTAVIDCRGLDVMAVRGPRTLALLRDCDGVPVVGDPGTLLPFVYTPVPVESPPEIGVIAHHAERDLIHVASEDRLVMHIDVTDTDWRRTVDRIASCQVVIASSLHAIVVAEAYGVPAVWVQPSDRIGGGIHKFLDYFEGTDREARFARRTDSVTELVAQANILPQRNVEPLIEAAKRVLHRYRSAA
jgi:pyruvyltransferase